MELWSKTPQPHNSSTLQPRNSLTLKLLNSLTLKLNFTCNPAFCAVFFKGLILFAFFSTPQQMLAEPKELLFQYVAINQKQIGSCSFMKISLKNMMLAKQGSKHMEKYLK